MLYRRPAPDVDERIKLASDKRPMLEGSSKTNRSDKVRYMYSEFLQRKSVTETFRSSEEENHGIYNGIGFGQWPKQVIEALEKNKKTRKDLSQFNFAFKKVNDVVGYLVRNWYDIDYLSVDGENTDTMSVIKDLYFSDKELCDWDTEINDALTNGCIRSSDIMMYVDYRYDGDFGNIAIKSLPPGSVLRDPNWISKNSGDCRSAMTVSYMTPNDIKDKYRVSADRIDALIMLKELESTSRSVFDGALPQFNLSNEYNKEYQVIEHHYMKKESRTTKIGMTAYGTVVDVPNEADDSWYEINGVDKEAVIEKKGTVDVYYVTTICPDLDIEMPIEDRKGMLQIGRLPIIHWSYGRHNGVDVGIIDLVKDPQRYYNQMMSLSHEIIAFARRVRLVDPEIFGNDIGNLDELEVKLNTPGATVFTESGALKDNPNAIQEASPSTYTGNELNLANTVKLVADSLTPYNSALGGEGSNERSAKHFDGKREQGEINMSLLNDSIKRFNNELAECYYYACQAVNGGIYRSFNTATGETIEINKQLPDGRVVNDISTLPRARVVVTESPSGVTRRINNRITAFEAIKVGNLDPITSSYMNEIIFDTMDNISSIKKSEIAKTMAFSREMMIKQQAAQGAQADMMLMQVEMQKMQMQQPQQMPPQAEGQMQAPPTEGQEQAMPPQQEQQIPQEQM